MNNIKICFLFLILFFSKIDKIYAKNYFDELEKKINQTLEDRARLDLEKEQIELKIKNLQERIKERKVRLLERSRALHYLKNYQWGSLLLSETPSTLERNIKILGELNKYDINLFKDFRKNLQLLGQSRIDLVNTQNELQTNVLILKKQQSDLILKEEERLEEIKKGSISSLLYYKKNLARPISSPIATHFGYRTDRLNQYTLVSKGLIYNTQPKIPVKAVGPGVIIFSDHLDYWSETLIIQHDDNYYSVYAGVQANANLLKKHVDKEDVIGLTNGNEFYFELRHFDNPINPLSWFKESL